MRRLVPSFPAMTARERAVLVATCVSSLGSFYTMAVTTFAMPQIQRGLEIPEDELGSLFALMRFGTLFSLGLGVLADRVGRRRLLIASVIGVAACNIATAFVQSGTSLAALQLCARLFVGGQILLAGVVVSEELSAENRGFGLGILTAVGGLGGALTLLAYSFVDQLPFGWRSLFILGGFGLLVVPWLIKGLQETQRFEGQEAAGHGADTAQGGARPLSELFGRHAAKVVALVLIVLPVTVILEPGSVFVSKHLQDGLGYSPAQVGLMLALCGIGAPVGNMLGGTLSDKLGRRTVTIGVSCLLSGAVALFYNAATLPAISAGLAMLFVSIGGLQVLHIALSTELFPTDVRSTASGVREAAGTIGSSLGLALTSALYGFTGSHADSVTWMLVLTPIAPLVLLFVPETAGRELEEITPSEPPATDPRP